MPVSASKLLSLPGPTAQDLIEHPERHPTEMAQVQQTLAQVGQTMVRPALQALAALQEEWASDLRALEEAFLQPVLGYFAPGTLSGDLWLARDGDVAALLRLAERLPWAPSRKSPAWAALAQRAEEEGVGWESARRQALVVGLYEALRREDEPQRIRLGQEYLIGEGGSLLIRPAELPLDLHYRWLRTATINGMEAHLLGEPYPPVRQRQRLTLPLDEAADIADDLTPEDIVLQQELEDEQRRAVEAVLALATPTERELLLAYLECPGDWAEAARRRGLAPPTGRVLLHRLRRRLRHSF